MSILELLVPFHPINPTRVVFSSDLEMDPLNLYPIYKRKVAAQAIFNECYGMFCPAGQVDKFNQSK